MTVTHEDLFKIANRAWTGDRVQLQTLEPHWTGDGENAEPRTTEQCLKADNRLPEHGSLDHFVVVELFSSFEGDTDDERLESAANAMLRAAEDLRAVADELSAEVDRIQTDEVPND